MSDDNKPARIKGWEYQIKIKKRKIQELTDEIASLENEIENIYEKIEQYNK